MDQKIAAELQALGSVPSPVMDSLVHVGPSQIEERSFQTIDEELGARGIVLDPASAPVVKRVIHTTADFDYAQNLVFSRDAAALGAKALLEGATIVTDTSMATSGIAKRLVEERGGKVVNFIADPDVAAIARERGVTRSAVAMERAAAMGEELVFAIGNAPTALIRLYELIKADAMPRPKLIVGVPVGFVNVVESKELVMGLDVPYIVAKGRKGGSNVAASIVNALLYMGEPGSPWRHV